MASSIWISGIGSGIGLAAARRRLALGDRVAGFSRGRANLGRLQLELGPQAHLASADLRQPEQLAGWCRDARSRTGDPAVVLHCAAVLGPRRPLAEVDAAAWQEVMEINLGGAFHFLRAVCDLDLPPAPRLWVWVDSSVAYQGRAGWGPYAASKAGLANLAETWAEEGRAADWTSVTLNPGGTRTAMRAAACPDEDPASLPAADAVAGAFDLLVRQWQAGNLANGAHLAARSLLPDLAGPA